MVKIEKKIMSVSIVKGEEKPLKRPPVLGGSTYKIKPPVLNSTIYITLNNDEGGKLFEIFINTKHLENKQWMDAITRMLSSAFRRNDYIHLIDEMKQVHDPLGFYFYGGRRYPSVVAHIGWVIDEHINGKILTKKDILEAPEKLQEASEASNDTEVKATGTECPECHEMTLNKDGGCTRCTNNECGFMGECG